MKDQKTINRKYINREDNCFITLKDHKDNFLNNPTTRLINPKKNELGRISKYILQQLKVTLKEKLELGQWKSTSEVLTWFNHINNKHQAKFSISRTSTRRSVRNF